MDMHEVAYNASQRIMDLIRTDLQAFIARKAPVTDKLRLLAYTTLQLEPYRQFDFTHKLLGYGFSDLLNTYELLHGVDEAERFEELLRDEIRQLAQAHLEYLQEVEKQEGQRVLMAESFAETA